MMMVKSVVTQHLYKHMYEVQGENIHNKVFSPLRFIVKILVLV